MIDLKTGSTLVVSNKEEFKGLQSRTQHFYNEMVRAQDALNRRLPEPEEDELWDAWDEEYEAAYTREVRPAEKKYNASRDALLESAIKYFEESDRMTPDLLNLFESALGRKNPRKTIKARDRAVDLLLKLKVR